MLENARVVAFTFSKLFRENQQGMMRGGGGGGVKLPPLDLVPNGLSACMNLLHNIV